MKKDEAAKILGVGINDTLDNIRKAFKRKSKKHHPDAGGSNEAFLKLQLACDILLGSDEPKMEMSQAVGELLNAFRSVLGRTHNPLAVDIIAKTKSVLLDKVREIEASIGNILQDKETTEQILKRLKCSKENNIIGNMLQIHLDGSASALAEHQSKLLNIQEAIILLNVYTYEADKPENNLSGGLWDVRVSTYTTS